ncbi:MAG: hypothetical protein EOP00_19230 [Pedobacter sp.]|nr:MAG: hypothetical protein EOP00_19230 [Pedobacter sp.]
MKYKDLAQFKTFRGTSLTYFRCLLSFLILFGIGRLIFRRLVGREYVTPSIGGSRDIIEDIQPSTPDFLMFGALFLLTIASSGI